MTIFKRNMISLGAAVLVFFTVVIVSVMVFMNSLYYEINMKGLGNTAKTLMSVIGENRLNEIFASGAGESAVSVSLPLGANDDYRVTLINTSGYVLWDSHVNERLVNHVDREEVIAALNGREGSSRRDSISTGMRRIYYALPVFDNNNNIAGVFRLSISIPEFAARVSAIVLSFSVFICVFIAVAFWGIVMYSRSLSSSLGRLVNIAKSGVPLLSGAAAEEPVSLEFKSLEKALRAMTAELNLRFEQAKSGKNRLEAILNGMAEAVFAANSGLKLHLVNPRARQLFNLQDSDVSAMTLLEATHSTDIVETAKKAVLTGVPIETELTFHSGLSGGAGNLSNAEQHFQVYVSPLVSREREDSPPPLLKEGALYDTRKDFEIEGVVLVMQEITQLVKLERVRRDFVANVSHELRTPIQIIKGFSETLLDDALRGEDADKKQIKHFIEIIHKNAEIMQNLTDDLLILSSLENNTVSAREMEDCFAAGLVSEAVSAVEVQARNKNIEIIADCPENLKAALYGSFIIQALINLLDNGIKYSPSNSKIRISAFLSGENNPPCKDHPAAGSETAERNSNSELVFEVRDKGIGIASDQLERIFERFYRVDRAGRGTGLGLSIVRHIALLHKGSAEAESRAGEGSVFRIRIPSHNHNIHYKDYIDSDR